jgi:hypothetical protein
MTPPWEHARALLGGPLLEAGPPSPLTLFVTLCDLRPRFIPKGTVGRGHRAIARNGRVLLCSDAPVADLAGRPARLRLQTWHRAILPGDPPEPYGLLLNVRTRDIAPPADLWAMRLVGGREAAGSLWVEVGGGLVLDLSPATRVR